MLQFVDHKFEKSHVVCLCCKVYCQGTGVAVTSFIDQVVINILVKIFLTLVILQDMTKLRYLLPGILA